MEQKEHLNKDDNVLNKLFQIILLVIINLTFAVISFALFVFVSEFLDKFNSLILAWIVGIAIFGLFLSANVLLYKNFYYSKWNKFVYIGVCLIEYAGIIISVLSFISRIAD